MKNYNTIQESIKRLIANADRLAGLLPNDLGDRTAMKIDNNLNNCATEIDELMERLEELEERKVRVAPAKRRQQHHRRASILPIGFVNTKTGSNKTYSSIWTLWAEDKNKYNILVTETGTGKYRLIHTSSDMTDGDYMAIGDILHLKHDQDFYSMGSWEIVAQEKHTKEGLMNLGALAGKASIPTATFK